MDAEEALNNEIKILTNQDLIKNVVATVGIENLYPEMVKDGSPVNNRMLEIAAMMFGENLSASPIKESNIVEVSFKHEKPAIAAQALTPSLNNLKISISMFTAIRSLPSWRNRPVPSVRS